MSDAPRTIGWSDYRYYCRLLGRDPDESLLPADRGEVIPSWLTMPLVATEFAREKLSRWVRGSESAWTLHSLEVIKRLSFFGDEELFFQTLQVLPRLPAPVRHYAIDNVNFIGVGRAILGFCGARPDLSERPWTIVLSAVEVDRFPDLLAHEVAHAWLLSEPPANETLAGAFWRSVVFRMPIPDVVKTDTAAAVLRARAVYDRGEREVQALTRDWGFRDF